MTRLIAAIADLQDKSAVFPAHGFRLLAGVYVHASIGDDCLPYGQQGLLAAVGNVQTPAKGHFHRFGHQKLVAGILLDG
jgi:hypothetical protein